MQSKATTVSAYLKALPADRREALETLRQVFLKNLGKGFEEGMQYGMIGYFVPHSVYPPGYHCNPKEPLPFAGLASQKNHMSMYLMCIYGDEKHRERFVKEWTEAHAKGKAGKLDMGKGCIRFKKIEDVPLKVVGDAIKRVKFKDFIDHYESVIRSGNKRAASKAASKKKISKKTTKKKVAKKTAKKVTKKTSKRVAKKASGRR